MMIAEKLVLATDRLDPNEPNARRPICTSSDDPRKER